MTSRNLLVALVLLAATRASAQTTSNVFDLQAALTEKNGHASEKRHLDPAAGERESVADAILRENLPFAATGFEGGETIADAFLIVSLPFTATGYTCDNLNDYDEVCPYSGSTSPDVVYRYDPASNQAIDIDLCPSGYDTKVYVYLNSAGNLVACNDDAGGGCGPDGYRSRLLNVPLAGGNSYYIVVDGYGGDCGEYVLSVREHTPCETQCTPSSQIEGEPPCGPNYVDAFNGGCNSSPVVFSSVHCSSICGKTGTYLFNGSQYRDTDWYRLTVGSGNFQFRGRADNFSIRLSLLSGNCPMSVVATRLALECNWSPSIIFSGPGTFVLFVAPEQFDGVPCESDYQLEIAGPGIPPCLTATQETSWGRIKGLFRP